jgi:hypothetical protein
MVSKLIDIFEVLKKAIRSVRDAIRNAFKGRPGNY